MDVWRARRVRSCVHRGEVPPLGFAGSLFLRPQRCSPLETSEELGSGFNPYRVRSSAERLSAPQRQGRRRTLHPPTKSNLRVCTIGSRGSDTACCLSRKRLLPLHLLLFVVPVGGRVSSVFTGMITSPGLIPRGRTVPLPCLRGEVPSTGETVSTGKKSPPPRLESCKCSWGLGYSNFAPSERFQSCMQTMTE